tara:strand:+ start:18 stop:2162 length:2145 start_codon:yes stop_codon:yes gene_type:complete
MNTTAGATQITIGAVSLNNANTMLLRCASPSLAAQTIGAQNWKLNIAREVDDIVTAATQWGLRLYVFRPSSLTVVGYIVGSATAYVAYTGGSENTSINTEQSFGDTAFSGSAVTTQDGDWLVCEVAAEETSGNASNVKLYHDGTTVTESDDTTVTNHASFIESTSNLTFSGAQPAKVAGKLVVFDQPSTWTDTTADTDTNINGCQAVLETEYRVVALSQYPFDQSGGQNGRIFAVSQDNAVWEVVGPQVHNNFMYIDAAIVAGTLNILYVDDHTYTTRWFRGTISDIDSTSAPTIADTVASRELPRGIIAYPNSSGTESAWISAYDGLYLENDRMVAYLNPTSVFTGKVKRGYVNGADSLAWSDGPNVYQGFWSEAGIFNVINLGPQSVGDGLPTAKQGDVTDLYVSNERPWVFAAVGGADGSHNGHVMILRTDPLQPKLTDHEWHRPYYNSTADRQIRAIAVSREDDGTNRLHMMEDTSTSDDVDGFYFLNILDNPTQISGYTYAASGLIRTSRFGGYSEVLLNGFFTIQVIGDDFSSDEDIALVFFTNGGNQVTNTSKIEARGQYRWVDQTDTTAGVGTEAYDLDFQATLARAAGTDTNAPKVRALSLSYKPNPLTAAGLKPRWWRMRVSRDPDDYEASDESLRPELVMSQLETSIAKGVLVAFSFDEGPSNAVSANVEIQPYFVEQEASERGDIEKPESMRPVVVELREVV